MDRITHVIYMDSGHMEYILAYWLSAWILSIIRLMIPALKLIRILDKNNIVVRRKVTGFISSLIIFLIASPFLVYPLLSEEARENFLVDFCDAILRRGSGI